VARADGNARRDRRRAFGALYTVDHYFTGGPASAAPGDSAERYFFFDQDHITDAVSSLGGWSPACSAS